MGQNKFHRSVRDCKIFMILSYVSFAKFTYSRFIPRSSKSLHATNRLSIYELQVIAAL